jgi:hypothetical protein
MLIKQSKENEKTRGCHGKYSDDCPRVRTHKLKWKREAQVMEMVEKTVFPF